MNKPKIIQCDLGVKDPTRSHNKEQFSAIAKEFLEVLQEFTIKHGVSAIATIGSTAMDSNQFIGACAVMTKPAMVSDLMFSMHESAVRFMELTDLNERLNG